MNTQTKAEHASFLQVAERNFQTLRRLKSAPPRLVVIGHFNAGKSTFINALLGKRLLPSGLKPTTGTVIRIVWGAQEQTTLRFVDGRMKTAAGTALLDEYAVIGSPGNTELLEDIQIETPTPFLKAGCTVIDVPGMEDDPRRYEAIFLEILFADLVLSVHDIEQQMPLSEIELLRNEVIANGCVSLSLIFNKCNLLEAEDVEVALAGAVSRLDGLALEPLGTMRLWYRVDIQPELKSLLHNGAASSDFNTLMEDIQQALGNNAALRERRRRKLAALRAVLQMDADSDPECDTEPFAHSSWKGTTVESFAQVKQKTLQVCGDCIALTSNHADLRKRLEQTKEQLALGKLTVVVAGEFKRGKSMLLNAFLNTPELMPTDFDIATSVVTNVLYGERERIRVVIGEVGKETMMEISRSEIRDFVTERGNPKNQRRVRLLLIELPLPELKDGLTFVDTPGIGGVFAEHTAVTYAYLPNADVVLFVTDALRPLTTDDIEFLRERILPHTRHIVFVVTKIDKVENYAQIVESNRAKLATVMEQSPESIQIVPVSSLLKLRHGQSAKPDPADLEYSNFPMLEATIWKLLREKRGQILLQRTLVEVGRTATQIRAPLQAEWDAMQQKTREEIAAQERELLEAQRTLKSYTSNSADWLNTLSDGLVDIRRNLQSDFQEGFVTIRRRMNGYVENPRLMDAPETIAGNIEADIGGMMAQLGNQLNEEASALHGRLEAETGLDINPFECGGVSWHPPRFNPNNRSAPVRTVYEKAADVGRSGVYTATAGATVGGVVGGIVGGVLGFLVGGPVGAMAGAAAGAKIGGGLGLVAGKAEGVRRGLRQVQEPDRTFYIPLLRDFIDDSERACQRAFDESVREMERAMRDELRGQLTRAVQATEESIAAVQKARTRTAEETKARIQPLQKQLQAVTAVQNRAAELSQAAMQFTEQEVPAAEAGSAASDADMGDWADA